MAIYTYKKETTDWLPVTENSSQQIDVDDH